MQGIYIASKAKYGGEWIKKREEGVPIISSWIDEFEPGATDDFSRLWVLCIHEASTCEALVAICREGDELKGALAEIGAAIASNVPVFAHGLEKYTISKHPFVCNCASEEDAFEQAMRYGGYVY